MPQDIANEKQNLSYTNLDFSSIYVEVLDMIKQLTKDWDPSISNESDPGVVLVKLSALLADKCNYNIDKSILEAFPLSVTQESNARQLYEQLGYYMNWYNAASTLVSLNWRVTTPSEDSDEYAYTIPKFTTVTNDNETVVYTLIGVEGDSDVVVSDGTLYTNSAKQLNMIAYEGIPTSYTFNGQTTITPSMVDENNRLYFATSLVFENGIFIKNVEQDNYSEWHRVNNLYEYSYNVHRYKFGYDSASNLCYIEFPDNYAELFGSGIEIVYLTFSTDEPYSDVPSQYLTKLLTDIQVGEGDNVITLNSEVLNVSNVSQATGHKDKESINEAYKNYKKTVGTFNTLITLRDYANYIKSKELDICSNAIVTDRTNDVQSTYQILTNKNGVESLVTEVAQSNDAVKFVKTLDEDISPFKTYYKQDPTTKVISKVEYDELSVLDLPNYFELSGDDILSPFSLKCYLLNKSVALTSRAVYDNTFIPMSDKINMNDLLEDTSHLVHHFESIEPLNKNIDFSYKYQQIISPEKKTASKLTIDYYAVPGKQYFKKNNSESGVEFEDCTSELIIPLENDVYAGYDDLTNIEIKDQYNNNVYWIRTSKDGQYNYTKVDRIKNKNQTVIPPGVYFSGYDSETGKGIGPFALGSCLTDANNNTEYFTKVSIQLESKDDLLSNIIFIKNKYPLDMNVSTYSPLGYDTRNDVTSNIIKALYQNLDSSNIDFGTAVSQDYLKTIIKNADTRIKDVSFDTTSIPEMFAVYYDQDKNSYDEIKLPSSYVDISNGVEYYDEGAYLTGQLSDILSNKIGKEIVCKSILKGVTQLLVPASAFNYHLNNQFIMEQGDIKYITGEAIIDLNNTDNYYSLIDEESSTQKLTKSYTLKENETITLFKPAFNSVQDFTSGVHYDYVCYQGLLPNQTYQLGSGEKFVFYIANTDSTGNTISYTVYVFLEGSIISSTEKIEPRNYLSLDSLRNNTEGIGVGVNYYSYTETSTDKCVRINNDTNISNTKVGTNETISIKEVDSFTVNEEDGYRFLWVLNKPIENNGELLEYKLFDSFDPQINDDLENDKRINSYTLKSGELLYYADKSLSKLGVLGAGTTITRNCGVDLSNYTKPETSSNYNRRNASGFTFINVNDIKNLGIGSGIKGIRNNSEFNPYALGLYETSGDYEYVRTNDTTAKDKDYFVLLMKDTSGWYVNAGYNNDFDTPVKYKSSDVTTDVFTPVDYIDSGFIFDSSEKHQIITYNDEGEITSVQYEDVNPSTAGLYEQVEIGNGTVYDSYRLANKYCNTSDDYISGEYKSSVSTHPRYTDTLDTTMFESDFLTDSLEESVMDTAKPSTFRTFSIDENNAYNPSLNKYLYKNTPEDRLLTLENSNSSVFIPIETDNNYNQPLNYIDNTSGQAQQVGRHFYKLNSSDNIYNFERDVTVGLPLTGTQVELLVNEYSNATLDVNTSNDINLINETNDKASYIMDMDDVASEFRLNVFEDTNTYVGQSLNESIDNYYLELTENDFENASTEELETISNNLYIGFKDYYGLCNDGLWDSDKTYLGYDDNSSEIPSIEYKYDEVNKKLINNNDSIDLTIYVPSESTYMQPGVTYYSGLPRVYQLNEAQTGKYELIEESLFTKNESLAVGVKPTSTNQIVNSNYLVNTANINDTYIKQIKKLVDKSTDMWSSDRTYYNIVQSQDMVQSLQQTVMTSQTDINLHTGDLYMSLFDDECKYMSISSANTNELSSLLFESVTDMSEDTSTKLRLITYNIDKNPSFSYIKGAQLLEEGVLVNSTGFPKYSGVIFDSNLVIPLTTNQQVSSTSTYMLITKVKESEDNTGNIDVLPGLGEYAPHEVSDINPSAFTEATTLTPDTYYYNNDKSLHFYLDSDSNAYTYDSGIFVRNDDVLETTKSPIIVSGQDAVPTVGSYGEQPLYYVESGSTDSTSLASDYLIDSTGKKYRAYSDYNSVEGESHTKGFKQFTRTITEDVKTLDGGVASVQLGKINPNSGFNFLSVDEFLKRHLKMSQHGEGILYFNNAECLFNVPRTSTNDIKYTKKTTNGKTSYSLNFDVYFRYKDTTKISYSKGGRGTLYTYSGDKFNPVYVAREYYLPSSHTFTKNDGDSTLTNKLCNIGGYELVSQGEIAEAGVNYYYSTKDVDFSGNTILNKFIKIDRSKKCTFIPGEQINSQGGSGGKFIFKEVNLRNYFWKRSLSGTGADQTSCLNNLIANFKKLTYSNSSTKIYTGLRVPIRYYKYKYLSTTRKYGLDTANSYDFNNVPAAYSSDFKFGLYTSGTFPINDYYVYDGTLDDRNPSELGYYEKKYAESPSEWNQYQSFTTTNLYSSNKDLACFVSFDSVDSYKAMFNNYPLYQMKTANNDSDDSLTPYYVSYPLRYTSLNADVRINDGNEEIISAGDDLSDILYTVNRDSKKASFNYANLTLVDANDSDNKIFSYNDVNNVNYSVFNHTFKSNMDSLVTINDMLSTWLNAFEYTTHIMFKPHWYTLGLYYRLKKNKTYYKPLDYEIKTFNAIPAWTCSAEVADSIAENPKSKLNEIFSRLQFNTEVTFTKNQLWTLSQGDVITATTEAQNIEPNLFPVFSNTESELDLNSYDISYQRVGNEFEDLESITIPGYSWRGYSNLQLNCAGTNGQQLASNHTLTLYDENLNSDGTLDVDELRVISNNNEHRNVHFQLEHPIENKTGSFIDVSTYSQTRDELLNSIYVYNVIDSGDKYNFTSDYNTYLYFKKLEDDAFSSKISIENVSLSEGDYLIPINGLSDGKLSIQYRYFYKKAYISAWTEILSGDTFVYRYEDNDEVIQTIVSAIDNDLGTFSLMHDNELIVEDVNNLGDTEWNLQFNEGDDSGRIPLIDAVPETGDELTLDVVAYTDLNKKYFLGNKTHFGYLHIPDEQTIFENNSWLSDGYKKFSEVITFTLVGKDDGPYVPTDDIVYIILNDIFKFNENPDLSYSMDEIKTKIQQLDVHSSYNYIHQPSDNDLIKDPLEPKAYWDKNHPYNSFTIAQLNADKINVRYIT